MNIVKNCNRVMMGIFRTVDIYFLAIYASVLFMSYKLIEEKIHIDVKYG